MFRYLLFKNNRYLNNSTTTPTYSHNNILTDLYTNLVTLKDWTPWWWLQLGSRNMSEWSDINKLIEELISAFRWLFSSSLKNARSKEQNIWLYVYEHVSPLCGVLQNLPVIISYSAHFLWAQKIHHHKHKSPPTSFYSEQHVTNPPSAHSIYFT
jgi:hypothetical protein